MAKIYEFAVIYNPPKKEVTDTNFAKLIVPQTTILAETDEEARIKAARAIPEDFINKLDQVELVIRPF